MKKNELFPSVLAFARKINPSDGTFFGTCWDNRQESVPLSVSEKSVRGTMSNRVEKNFEKANLQTVDYCALPYNCDTLKMAFTVKFIGNLGEPTACNNQQFKKLLLANIKTYCENNQLSALAERYAYNLACGRFLWRNRFGAEKIEVNITCIEDQEKFSFDAVQYPVAEIKTDDAIKPLAAKIQKALQGNEALTFDVCAYIKLGQGQEVYPSEELVLDKGKLQKSKILYATNGQAAMHSQKIGNALRTIDTWYPDFYDPSEGIGPIAIEVYGSVTSLGKAFRTPANKSDFYSLFNRFVTEKPDLTEDETHYVIAMLIRGGVFGEKAEKKE